jgi:hypothetical protein
MFMIKGALQSMFNFGAALPMFMKDDQLEKVINYNLNQWVMK